MAAGQWEYRILELDLTSPRAPEALNNAGREGWEGFAGSIRSTGNPGERLVVLLKRPRRANVRSESRPRVS